MTNLYASAIGASAIRSYALRASALVALAFVPLACGGPRDDAPEALGRTTSALGGAIVIDWSMPDMFGNDFDGDGLIDLTPVSPTDPARSPVVGNPVRPSGWKVNLDGCKSPAASDYLWIVNLPAGPQSFHAGCSTQFTFPAEGNYDVQLVTYQPDGSSATNWNTVVVKNYFLVSMGDSVASGEGNPDVPGFVGSPRWVDRRCHRSANSGPARAALDLERSDPHTSVTFISVACSGARIDEGLLGTYMGQEPPDGAAPLPPQIDQVRSLACPNVWFPAGSRAPPCQKIDALLIHVGANDVGFADVVMKMATPLRTASHDDLPFRSFVEDFESTLAALPGKYDTLAASIKQRLNVDRTFITEYFNPTHDDAGQFCGSLTLPGAVSDAFAFNAAGFQVRTAFNIDGDIDHDDVVWASDHVIGGVNRHLHDAARRHGWTFVPGIAREFRQHGYCAADHWIVRYEESKANQADSKGSMHPNRNGHRSYARHIGEALEALTAPPPATVSVASPDGNRIDVFTHNDDGSIATRNWTGSWGPWQRLDGNMVGTPAAIWNGPSVLEVYALSKQGYLYRNVLDVGHNVGWSGWTPRPAPWPNPEPGSARAPESIRLYGTPVLATQRAGDIDIFMPGEDGALYHQSLGGGIWMDIGAPPVMGTPSVVANAVNRFDLVMRGADGQVQHAWENLPWESAGNWAWEPLANSGNFIAGDPKIVSWAPGRLDIFARGGDMQLWHDWYQGWWGGWEPLGGFLTSQIDVTSWGPGRLDILSRGPNLRLIHDWYDWGWGAFYDFWVSLASGPDALSARSGALDITFLHTDRNFYNLAWRNETGWRALEFISPKPARSPDCGVLRPGQGLISTPSKQDLLRSCDGRFSLYLQADGNLVLYDASGAIWASNSAGSGATAAVLEGDGQLVLYTATGTRVWSTGKVLGPNAALWVQDDANLVIYNANASDTWASGTGR